MEHITRVDKAVQILGQENVKLLAVNNNFSGFGFVFLMEGFD
jgi:hypothetical protein